ncbi:hypothetical protein VHEMI06454 [[Torrubiella] hemipterigena]|uniref:Uncharacterized protein n=1 Tax=[Torrubiella] hemipterigena TaxID=1531966 RepID=A0A0A1T7D8_9HYPO|nr:hypothetical protein VHEMI06454 [[Torrubiella] hemipterigena]
MASTRTVVIGLASAVGMIQMAPAPVPVIAAIAGAAVRAAATYLAERDPHPGVSQESIDQCIQQINGQKNQGRSVEISGDDDMYTINVYVPAACMNLAIVLSGHPAQNGDPVPIPMGSDSLQYLGVSTEDRQNLADALGA